MLDDRTILRYQNGKSHTRQVSQNHRENYQNMTISDIFNSKVILSYLTRILLKIKKNMMNESP